MSVHCQNFLGVIYELTAPSNDFIVKESTDWISSWFQTHTQGCICSHNTKTLSCRSLRWVVFTSRRHSAIVRMESNTAGGETPKCSHCACQSWGGGAWRRWSHPGQRPRLDGVCDVSDCRDTPFLISENRVNRRFYWHTISLLISIRGWLSIFLPPWLTSALPFSFASTQVTYVWPSLKIQCTIQDWAACMKSIYEV